jgi:hypothetical protein
MLCASRSFRRAWRPVNIKGLQRVLSTQTLQTPAVNDVSAEKRINDLIKALELYGLRMGVKLPRQHPERQPLSTVGLAAKPANTLTPIPNTDELTQIVTNLFASSQSSSSSQWANHVQRINLSMNLIRSLFKTREASRVSPELLHLVMRQCGDNPQVISATHRYVEELVQLLVKVKGTYLRQSSFDLAVACICNDVSGEVPNVQARQSNADSERGWPYCYPRLPQIPEPASAEFKTLTNVVNMMHMYSYPRYALSVSLAVQNEQLNAALQLAHEAIKLDRDFDYPQLEPLVRSLHTQNRSKDIDNLLATYLQTNVYSSRAWETVIRLMRTSCSRGEMQIQLLLLSIYALGMRPSSSLHHYFLLSNTSFATSDQLHEQITSLKQDGTLQQLVCFHSAVVLCRQYRHWYRALEIFRDSIESAINDTSRIQQEIYRTGNLPNYWFMHVGSDSSVLPKSAGAQDQHDDAGAEYIRSWTWKRRPPQSGSSSSASSTDSTSLRDEAKYCLADIVSPELKTLWISLLSEYLLIVRRQPAQSRNAAEQHLRQYFSDNDLEVAWFHSGLVQQCNDGTDNAKGDQNDPKGAKRRKQMQSSQLAGLLRKLKGAECSMRHNGENNNITVSNTADITTASTDTTVAASLASTTTKGTCPNYDKLPFTYTVNTALYLCSVYERPTDAWKLYQAVLMNELAYPAHINYLSNLSFVNCVLFKQGINALLQYYTPLAKQYIDDQTKTQTTSLSQGRMASAAGQREIDLAFGIVVNAVIEEGVVALERRLHEINPSDYKHGTNPSASNQNKNGIKFYFAKKNTNLDYALLDKMNIFLDAALIIMRNSNSSQRSFGNVDSPDDVTVHDRNNRKNNVLPQSALQQTALINLLDIMAIHICTHKKYEYVPLVLKLFSLVSGPQLSNKLVNKSLRLLIGNLCASYEIAQSSTLSHPRADRAGSDFLQSLNSSTDTSSADSNSSDKKRASRMHMSYLREYILELLYQNGLHSTNLTAISSFSPSQAETRPGWLLVPSAMHIVSPSLYASLTPASLLTIQRVLNESYKHLQVCRLFERVCESCDDSLNTQIHLNQGGQLYWSEYLYAVSRSAGGSNLPKHDPARQPDASQDRRVLRAVQQVRQLRCFHNTQNLSNLLGLLKRYNQMESVAWLLGEIVSDENKASSRSPVIKKHI